jgi:hypothetical protein
METIEDIVYEAIEKGTRKVLDKNFKSVNMNPIYKHMSIRDKYSLAFSQIEEEHQ